jgi:nitrous oxide reductase accessory protein NosL
MFKKVILVIASTSLLLAGSIEVTKKDDCLIRHIKVYKNPAWIARAKTKQKTVYFSSPKSMFEYYFQPIKWTSLGAITSSDIVSVTVTDFNTLEAIDAKKAFYVYGSNQTSPGGDDLPAFATKKSAEAFAKKYNGKRVLSFDEISNALIYLINGRI